MILSDHLVMMILIRYRKSDRREGPTPYENSCVQNLKTGTSEHIYKPSFLNYKVGVNKHSPIHEYVGSHGPVSLASSFAPEVSVCGGQDKGKDNETEALALCTPTGAELLGGSSCQETRAGSTRDSQALYMDLANNSTTASTFKCPFPDGWIDRVKQA